MRRKCEYIIKEIRKFVELEEGVEDNGVGVRGLRAMG